ncbi:MAG: hypothetical protein AB7G80_01225 [Dongiaceae bacterium]
MRIAHHKFQEAIRYHYGFQGHEVNPRRAGHLYWRAHEIIRTEAAGPILPFLEIPVAREALLGAISCLPALRFYHPVIFTRLLANIAEIAQGKSSEVTIEQVKGALQRGLKNLSPEERLVFIADLLSNTAWPKGLTMSLDQKMVLNPALPVDDTLLADRIATQPAILAADLRENYAPPPAMLPLHPLYPVAEEEVRLYARHKAWEQKQTESVIAQMRAGAKDIQVNEKLLYAERSSLSFCRPLALVASIKLFNEYDFPRFWAWRPRGLAAADKSALQRRSGLTFPQLEFVLRVIAHEPSTSYHHITDPVSDRIREEAWARLNPRVSHDDAIIGLRAVLFKMMPEAFGFKTPQTASVIGRLSPATLRRAGSPRPRTHAR